MTNVFLVMFVAIANIYMLKIKKKKSYSQKWIIFYWVESAIHDSLIFMYNDFFTVV